MSSVLVTGASGFIGEALCAEMMRRNFQIKAALRSHKHFNFAGETIYLGDIDGSTQWGDHLKGIDVVIHLAARVHVMRESNSDPLEAFRRVNVWGTEHLARMASCNGVKRFVYVSSIGVNGVLTTSQSFNESDKVNPHNAYAMSKWEAEQALHRVAQETGLEIVIIRPPLVYGVGAPGNFAQMMHVISKQIPLPFADINNRRSFVYVGNLVDALITCAQHPAAAAQTYLISDGDDISTPDLLRQLGVGMRCPVRLFALSPKLLKWIGAFVGKSDQVDRLTGSLQVDSGKIRRELNWTPPYTLQQGLQATAEWYRSTHL